MTTIISLYNQTKSPFHLLFVRLLSIYVGILKEKAMLHSLIDNWKSKAAATAMAVGLAFGAVAPAHAGEVAQGSTESHPVYEFIQQEPQSARTAFRGSVGKIVFHYGEGVKGVPAVVWALRNSYGYPAIAVAGASENEVEVFVDRAMVGKFTQRDIDRGEAGGMASVIFDKKVGKPTGPLAALD